MVFSPDLLQVEYAGNTVQAYLTAVAVFFGILLVCVLGKRLLIGRLHALAMRTKLRIDNQIVGFLDDIGMLTYASIALYVSSRSLTLPSPAMTAIKALVLIVLVAQVVRILQKIIEFVLRTRVFSKKNDAEKQMLSILKPVVTIVLWSIALLLVLSNLGFNVTSLIASLGIGGVAVALALQNILGDIFDSFTIYIDKPFEAGDFIIVGEHMGTVKAVGIKTTRLTALDGEEVVIPNGELTSSRIRNFKRMEKRRIAFSFGVTYDTPPAQLKKIGKICKDIITEMSHATFDRAHFKSFGDSSLNFEVVYYVDSGDYATYMDTQQKINIQLLEELAKEKVEMAFPTRTIYMAK